MKLLKLQNSNTMAEKNKKTEPKTPKTTMYIGDDGKPKFKTN